MRKKITFQNVVSFGEYEAFQNVPLVIVFAIVLNITASVNKQNDQILTQLIRWTMELMQSAILQFYDKVMVLGRDELYDDIKVSALTYAWRWKRRKALQNEPPNHIP